MKKIVVLAGCFLAIFLTGCCDSGFSKTEYNIATGSKSGVYYPIGETLATILNEKHPGVKLNIIETAGSVENLQMVNDGKVDLALVQNDIAYYASQGEAMFADNRLTNIQGIATLFPEVVQIIVSKESSIESLNDLSGHRIAVGSPESGTYYNAKQILGKAGVWDSVELEYFGVGQAIEQMQAGELDGFIFTSGLPNPSIVELGKNMEISLLGIEPSLIQKIVNEYSFYFPSLVPANQYPGQPHEVHVVEINAILVCGLALNENDQYLLTRDLFNEPNELGQSHPRLNKMTRTSLRQQMPVNLAPGAYKAYTQIP